MDLGHSVDGLWPHDGHIRAGVPGRGGTKCSNCTRTEQSEIVHFTHFNDVVESSDVDLQW